MEHSHQQAGIMRYWTSWSRNWSSPLGTIENLISQKLIAATEHRGLRWLCRLYLNVKKQSLIEGFLKTPLISFPKSLVSCNP